MQTEPMRSFLFNLTSQWGGALYTAAVSLGLVFVVGRYLGPGAFGNYSYALTVAILFVVLQDGGFRRLIVREKTLASTDLVQYQAHLMPWALGHALVSTAIGVIVVLILPFPHHVEIGLAFLCLGLQAVVAFISAELRSQGVFPRDALWQATTRSVSAAAILLAMFLIDAQPVVIFAGWALGLTVALLLSPIPLEKPEFTGLCIKDIRRACVGFIGVEAATIIYSRSDIILLKYFSHCPEQVGYYAAAYRFLEGIALLSGPLSFIWFRNLRLARMDRELFRSRVVKMGFTMLAAGAIIGIAGILYSEVVIRLTFGKAYGESAPMLAWLLAALVFILPNNLLMQAAIAQNKERLYAIAAGLCALLNIGMNMMLIPRFGGLGAAWATIGTEAFLSMALVFGLWKAI